MSNTFNISVKPEIAAAVVKIDANKTAIDAIKNDTGPIRNDVTAIHDTNLPAVKSDTGPIRNDVTAIHDTMLPAVKVDTGAIRNDMNDIHDTDLPAVKIDTTAILNRANAIKAITDLLPLSSRGTFHIFRQFSSSASYVDVINFTGSGKLHYLSIRASNAADTVQILVTLDGVSYVALTHTGDTTSQVVVPQPEATTLTYLLLKLAAPQSAPELFNIEFKTSCRIQLQRSAGSGGHTSCQACWSED